LTACRLARLTCAAPQDGSIDVSAKEIANAEKVEVPKNAKKPAGAQAPPAAVHCALTPLLPPLLLLVTQADECAPQASTTRSSSRSRAAST